MKKEYVVSLSRAKPEDIPALIQIHNDAFAPNILVQVCIAAYPIPDEEMAKRLLESLSLPNVAIIKAEVMSSDMPHSKVVAWSIWDCYFDKDRQSDIATPALGLGFLPAGLAPTSTDQNSPAGSLPKILQDSNAQWSRQWFAHRDFMHLALLCVAPQFQGRGIGEKILDWGTKEADRRGLVCTLTATPVAWQIYERYGWHVVDEQSVDLSEWFSSGGLERRENDQVAKDMGYGTAVWRRMIRLPQLIQN